MADLYSTNYTKQYVNVPAEKIPAGEQYGNLRVAYDDYTFAADVSLTAADNITFMKIPRGARIIDMHITHTDLGASSAAIDVGWSASDDGSVAADQDGFLDGYTGITSAGSTSLGILDGRFKKFTAEGCYVVVKIMHDDVATTTSSNIKIALLYVVE